MSDFKETNLVVQSNKLIQQSNNEMNPIPLKIFKVLISCIDTNHPKKEVVLTKNDLVNFISGENSPNYSYIKSSLKEIMRTVVKIQDDPDHEILITIMQKIDWNKKTEDITCTFHEDILPFLVELKERFTQYPVTNLMCLKTKYGIILYELIKSNTYIKPNGFQYHRFFMEVNDLRKRMGTGKKYPVFKDFEKYVLKVAVDEINKNSGELKLKVDYEKVKVGRSVRTIRFNITTVKDYMVDENVDKNQISIEDIPGVVN